MQASGNFGQPAPGLARADRKDQPFAQGTGWRAHV